MRALGFDAKKSEVLKILKDHDKDGRGLMNFEDFNRVSMVTMNELKQIINVQLM
jgi:Ca2+-binding EF-hand superfamily protein